MTLLAIMIGGILGWLVFDSIMSEMTMRRSLKQGKEVLQKMEQVFALLKAKMSEEELRELAVMIYEESGEATPFEALAEEWQRPHVEAARSAEKFVKESLFRHYGESEADNGR